MSEFVDRMTSDHHVRVPDVAQHAVDQVLRTPGAPMDLGTREFMEQRFRRDFAHVRVHVGRAAGQFADALGAKAFTVGHHMVFGPGAYAPEADDGKRSIAHELAHVVQQSRGGAPAPGLDAGHTLEYSADAVAGRITHASTVDVGGASAPGIARLAGETPWWKRKVAALYQQAAPVIAKVEQFVTAVNEAPSLSEVVARTVEEYAAKANPETKSGAALQSMSKVFTATAKVTSKPRRALVRGFIAGKPAAAVAEFQQDMDSGLKELKEATFSGIEAYEEGKFGDVPDPIMYPVDKVTGGKVSRFSRQVQGGLLKSLYTMGEGIVTIGVHPVRTIEGVAKIAEMVSPLPSPDTITNAVGFATDLVDPKLTAKDAAKRYLAAEEAEQQRRRTEMIALVKGLGENYLDAWKKERYGEIPGLLLGDVGSFFIGAGEARAATGAAKGAGTVGKLGDVAKLGEVGDVGKIAEGAKSLAPMAEGAKLAESAKGVEAAQLSKPALPKEIPAPIEPKTPAVPGLPGYRTPEVPPPVPDTPFFPAPEPRKPSIPPPEPKPVPAEPATPVPPEPRPVPPEPKTPVPPEPKVFPPTRRRRDPPPFRDWRDTLPANDNAIPTGSRPANDNAFAPKNAETAAQVEREVAEVAAVEEIPIKRAAGDFERHLPPGETLTTVDRPMAAASKRAAGQPLRTVGPTRPGGPGGPSATGRSLGGPARRPRRPAMPKEPPILPEGIRNRKITAREAIDFFEGNRRSYPAEIRQLIDDARRKPTKAAAVEIDSAVRNLYARRMNKALGYPDVGPRDQVIAPFRRSVKGHSPLAGEGGQFEALMEMGRDQRLPSLNLLAETKSGRLLDVDHFDPVTRTGREIKMPGALVGLSPPARAKIFDQIARHVEWTRDWGMRYTWELHSIDDLRGLQRAVRAYESWVPREISEILIHDILEAPGRGSHIRITVIE
ncbi:DUF4157 domain-containing protein [Nocardia sp. NBC_00508]|uniref:eCIS core domain-containing protein n=1 Tax=Nocardia sp. NBC_00508 TaxID=2975992 RepID=UPI002E80EEDA|nr:DUF4157 domain-containing protein [Nocardia sp. NBC_00508]WUD66780.1 DUF4157 domain-containing protein [Nocardia sp. NBC_00508]